MLTSINRYLLVRCSRIRVEHMERQLANLTGLVQKALTHAPHTSPSPRDYLQVPAGRDPYARGPGTFDRFLTDLSLHCSLQRLRVVYIYIFFFSLGRVSGFSFICERNVVSWFFRVVFFFFVSIGVLQSIFLFPFILSVSCVFAFRFVSTRNKSPFYPLRASSIRTIALFLFDSIFRRT